MRAAKKRVLAVTLPSELYKGTWEHVVTQFPLPITRVLCWDQRVGGWVTFKIGRMFGK